MSSYGRWEGCSIVVNEERSEDDGLEGSLKNALERGEDISRATQTLINAGYKQTEVSAAASRMSGQEIYDYSNSHETEEKAYYGSAESGKEGSSVVKAKKKLPGKVLLIIAIVSLLVAIGATLFVVFFTDFF